MGLSKTEEFTLRDVKLAAYAKALAHPARIAILRILLKKNTCICGDLVNELPLSQSTISQHLKELKSAGLIKGEIEGAKTCYCINPDEWMFVKDNLMTFFNSYSSGKNCC